MATYLDFQKFRDATSIPESFVDDVEKRKAGWVDNQLELWARWIDGRLRKRYASPFNAHDASPDSTPTIIQLWLARIVTWRVMVRRGVDPNDLQADTIKEDHDRAIEEIDEAADSEEGRFDIPLRTNEDGSAMRTTSPRGYSEASPYVYTDRQVATARREDDNGTGSNSG